MTKQTSSNFSGPYQFQYPDDDADAFDTQDWGKGGLALETHTHRATLGPGVGRIGSVAPATTGDVQITADALRWWGGTTGAILTAVDNTTAQTGLAGAKTWTGLATFSAGITVTVPLTLGTTPSTTGSIRMPTTVYVGWRNSANNGDQTIGFDGTDRFNLVQSLAPITTVGAAGGASALPATPEKYWRVSINSVLYVIPLYLP